LLIFNYLLVVQKKNNMRFEKLLFITFGLLLSLSSLKAERISNDNGSIVVEFLFDNPTDSINNVEASVYVLKGGEVTCKWSKSSVALSDTFAQGFTEGIPFNVIVYNSTGDSLFIEREVDAESASELLNSLMTPLTDLLRGVLSWDPFAAIGLYDPVVRNGEGMALLKPNGDLVTRGVPFIVVWLFIGAIFFTLYFKFINFTGIRETFRLLRGKYGGDMEKGAEGEMSHFQALATSLSATIGLGNIAGVAVAISTGGPGATFWMILAGLFGMTSKFTECILGVKYRVVKDGVVSGGPMYYMSRGISGYLGKGLAFIFALLCVGGSFGGGNMFQSNQAFDQAKNMIPELSGNGFYFGLIMAALVGFVIVGGIKSIAKVTDKIVPIMAVGYVLAALVIIGINIEHTPVAISQILEGAFNGDALKGGILGVMVVGIQRASFSNEAGVGSAAIAHSAVKTNYAASEGFVAMVGPFVDTVIVCLMTSLVLIFTGYSDGESGATGAKLTSMAFESVFSWYGWVLLVAILLFSFSTMISWSYYGLKAWQYVFGDSKFSSTLYKLLFLLFVVVGASSSLGTVMDFSDLMILAMAVPNILALYILLPKVKEELNKYWAKVSALK
jgi:alanine or glycine:cation symporter, AGCS family